MPGYNTVGASFIKHSATNLTEGARSYNAKNKFSNSDPNVSKLVFYVFLNLMNFTNISHSTRGTMVVLFPSIINSQDISTWVTYNG